MPQDQGPIQESQVSRIDQALQAHNLGDLIERTADLDRSIKIAINNTGLDLEVLMKKWKGEDSWRELEGKKVLDLASGSGLGQPQWQPFFARLCANNGAIVTAVDILPQTGSDKKLFHGVITDIVKTVMGGRLSQVVENINFDIIHSSSFVGVNPSPELQERLERLKIREGDFRQALLDQSFGLLSEGGIISLDEKNPQKKEYISYAKKEGKLVEL